MPATRETDRAKGRADAPLTQPLVNAVLGVFFLAQENLIRLWPSEVFLLNLQWRPFQPPIPLVGQNRGRRNEKLRPCMLQGRGKGRGKARFLGSFGVAHASSAHESLVHWRLWSLCAGSHSVRPFTCLCSHSAHARVGIISACTRSTFCRCVHLLCSPGPGAFEAEAFGMRQFVSKVMLVPQ